MSKIKVIPVEVRVDGSLVAEIHKRIPTARWLLAPKDDTDWKHGADAVWLKRFASYWESEYDWNSFERRVNCWPNFMAEIDGLSIHFIHVRGSSRRSRALVLTYGWPGSVIEFYSCVERLAFPERVGGRAEDGFDVVIPSLPGWDTRCFRRRAVIGGGR